MRGQTSIHSKIDYTETTLQMSWKIIGFKYFVFMYCKLM